eukprot:TRINITY_DN23326_c0_g1_i1.p1 TRINITY_DN23326_c0_g1~~TRINITY_DN23326_c0_g1_i1.p1  ORF type:complete len:286 (-),score=58.36 TRINITY_DN23326_c0_g1_i1:1330-2187(-)
MSAATVAVTQVEGQVAAWNTCEVAGFDIGFHSAPTPLEALMEVQEGLVADNGSYGLVSNEQRVACGFCGEAFFDEEALRGHLGEAHQRVPCPECHLVLVRSKLRKHMLIHSPDREIFPCQVAGCDRTYSTAFNREQHVRSAHKKERPFECSYAGCMQRFAFKASQLRHESNVHVAANAPVVGPPAGLLAAMNGSEHPSPQQQGGGGEEEGGDGAHAAKKSNGRGAALSAGEWEPEVGFGAGQKRRGGSGLHSSNGNSAHLPSVDEDQQLDTMGVQRAKRGKGGVK